MGQVTRGYLDDRAGQAYVSTKENVVAALDAESGEIVWRQVLEKGERGSIQALLFLNDDNSNPNSVRADYGRNDEGNLISVSGETFSIVRGWSTLTGNLAFEWTTSAEKNTAEAHWFHRSSSLFQVVPSWENAVATVYEYNTKNGQILTANTKKVPLKTTRPEDCDFVDSFLVCSSNNEVLSVNLQTGASEVLAKTAERHRLLSVREENLADCH